MPKNTGGYPYKGGTMSQVSEEAPQCPEDARAADYDNNHPNDWVRGKNEDATKMPHYDNSKKWK